MLVLPWHRKYLPIRPKKSIFVLRFILHLIQVCVTYPLIHYPALISSFQIPTLQHLLSILLILSDPILPSLLILMQLIPQKLFSSVLMGRELWVVHQVSPRVNFSLWWRMKMGMIVKMQMAICYTSSVRTQMSYLVDIFIYHILRLAYLLMLPLINWLMIMIMLSRNIRINRHILR